MATELAKNISPGRRALRMGHDAPGLSRTTALCIKFDKRCLGEALIAAWLRGLTKLTEQDLLKPDTPKGQTGPGEGGQPTG